MRKNLYAVILAGGKGERFWPLSSLKSPKYTLKIFGKKNLFEKCYDRAKLLCGQNNIYISTNLNQADIIKRKNLIVEPVGRNTAPAIGLSAVTLLKKNPKAVMVVMPADHLIEKKGQFRKDIGKAYKFVEKNPEAFVTFGIKPDRIAEEYGYIKRVTSHELRVTRSGVYPVARFIEKPSRKRATKFVKSKRYYWNSGIFVFKAKAFLDNLKKFNPKLYRGLTKGNVRKNFPRLPDISIDYCILEKAKRLFMLPARFDWDDVGSWLALERQMKRDKKGNVIKGKHMGLDTKNTVVYNTGKNVIATVGVESLIVVQTNKATLVASKEKVGQIKKLIRIPR